MWGFRAALAMGAVVAARSARAPGDTRPNLILYFPDTISSESMGPLFNNPIVQTPHLDAFALNATTFTTAYASFPQCSPSRAALVTGRHVHTLGHRTMTHLVQPWEPNLWAMLKSAGYTTLHFGKNDMLAQASFPASFNYWEDGTGVSQGPCPYAFGEAGYYSFAAGVGNATGNDTAANGDLKAVRRALAALGSGNVSEPFALFLPGIGAHPPYGVPKDYAGRYNPADIAARFPLRTIAEATGKPPYYGDAGIRGFRNYSAIDIAMNYSYEVVANYYARVTYTDWVFGQLLDGLETLGVMDRTAVAFASDHGDFQGNYGLVEKWSGAADDLLLRVPLVLRLPGGGPRLSVPAPVQLFDLLPTFLELAGVGGWLCSTDNVTGYVQFGSSLLPWARGEVPPPEGVHSYVYAEAGYYWQNEIEYNDPTQNSTWQDPHQLYYPRGQEEHLAPSHSVRLIAMRNATHKLVYRARGQGAPSELYDLAADPRELTNVWGAPAYAAVQAEMLADLLDWLVLTSDVTPGLYDPRGLPKPPGPPPFASASPASAASSRRLRTPGKN